MSPGLKRLPAYFYRLDSGREPVREWLKGLEPEDRRAIGEDISLLRLNWFFPNPIQRIRGSTSHRQRRPPLRPAVSPLIWTAVTFGCILISVTTMKPIARLMSNMVLTFAMISCAFAQPPIIRGIANAASGGSAVVPQMLVSIYGSNLAVQTATANALSLTTQLGGTAVAFNGIAAPLLYVSSEQINAQVPSGVRGSASANVVVTTAVGKSSAFSMPVNSGSAPGIFTQDSSGCGQAAALNIHA